MNELTMQDRDIKDKIYTVRGVQVMLDKDLALLYDVKPTRLREQVRRNNKKFPEDFMFELNEYEVEFMVSQNAIPSKKNISKQLKLEIEKYNSQYPKIDVKKFDLSHDRFLIIDEKEVYHFGASLKDVGKKWFAVSKIDIDSFEMIEKLQ